ISKHLAVEQLLQVLEGGEGGVGDHDIQLPNCVPEYIQGMVIGHPTVLFINCVGEPCALVQGDVLFVEEIKLAYAFRKCGLGLFLLDQADTVLNGYMSLCLLMPCPLQFLAPNMNMPWRDYDEEMMPPQIAAAKAAHKAKFDSARTKIENRFKRLGFGRLELDTSKFLIRKYTLRRYEIQ
ncbi:hypothetical protein As57867_014724, partial [Aphanomyces stellatus]